MYPTSRPSSLGVQLTRLGVAVKRAEIVMSFGAFGFALWHLARLDRSLISLAMFAALPPGIALFVATRSKTRTFGRTMAVVFLLLLSAAGLLASQPLSGWAALHQGNTDFADRFNKLDVYSRRMISVLAVLDAAFLFYCLGHGVLLTELKSQRAGYPVQISKTTCVLGLCFFWGMAAFMLIGGFIWLIDSIFGG